MTGQLPAPSRSVPPVVRTPDPPFARPGEFLRAAWTDLRRSPPLAAELARRDIRSQYRQSLLGSVETILPVLALTAAAVGFRRAGILTVDQVGIPYVLFVLCGLVLWTSFVDAVNAPIYGLLAEQRLLARTTAPPEAVVASRLAVVCRQAGVKAVLLAVVALWYGVAVPASILVAPVAALMLLALGTGIGLLVGPLNLVYRDLSRLLVAVTTVWFFFSPVYFPVPASGAVAAVMSLNPVTPLLNGARALTLGGPMPNPASLAAALLASVAVLLAGWTCLRVALPIALERSGP